MRYKHLVRNVWPTAECYRNSYGAYSVITRHGTVITHGCPTARAAWQIAAKKLNLA